MRATDVSMTTMMVSIFKYSDITFSNANTHTHLQMLIYSYNIQVTDVAQDLSRAVLDIRHVATTLARKTETSGAADEVPHETHDFLAGKRGLLYTSECMGSSLKAFLLVSKNMY